MLLRIVFAAVVVSIVASSVRAELVDLNITRREPYAEGRPIGDVGPCERLRGTARFALDPKLPANQAVVDLPLCPTDDEGRVTFSADVEILVPVDRAKCNGAALYEVNNRGNKTALNIFNGGGADDFLLRQGFVVVWSGWIAEVHPGDDRLTMTAPAPLENGKPLRGIVRQEVIVDKPVERASVMHRGALGAYRPAPGALDRASLTRRLREADPRETVPLDEWSLTVTEIEMHGKPHPLPKVELQVVGGLQPGLIYELIYEAEGSVVQGVGLAGIRDLVSFIKHDATQKTRSARPTASRSSSGSTASARRRAAAACDSSCTTASTRTNKGGRSSTA